MFPLRLSGYFLFNFLFWTSSFLISFSGLSFSLFLAYFLYLFFLFGSSYPFSYLFFLSVFLIYFSYLFFLSVFLIYFSYLFLSIYFSYLFSLFALLLQSSSLIFFPTLLFYSSFLFFFAILLYNSSLPAFILTHPPAFPLSFFMLTFFISGFKKNSNIYWQISQSRLY